MRCPITTAMSNLMVRTVSTYYCEVCDMNYRRKEHAEKCESSPMPEKPDLAVPEVYYYGPHYNRRIGRALEWVVGSHGRDHHQKANHYWCLRFDTIIKNGDHADPYIVGVFSDFKKQFYQATKHTTLEWPGFIENELVGCHVWLPPRKEWIERGHHNNSIIWIRYATTPDGKVQRRLINMCVPSTYLDPRPE